MGYALWMEEETAWCAGTHEYRPLGVGERCGVTLKFLMQFADNG